MWNSSAVVIDLTAITSPSAVCNVCIRAYVCVCLKFWSYREREDRERRERERGRLTERKGLGGPGHRWLWEADVPAELLGVVPASSETVTEVRRANRLPQNGWLDLGKQMLKNAFHASEMSLEPLRRGENSNSLKKCAEVLNPTEHGQKNRRGKHFGLTEFLCLSFERFSKHQSISPAAQHCGGFGITASHGTANKCSGAL